jgi:hypothetical protein
MARRAVTFSTDGSRDYVETPDGVKHILGIVSVLTLISKLVPAMGARRALEAYNATGSVMVTLDVDQMFELLAPKRQRFTSALIGRQDRQAWSSASPVGVVESPPMKGIVMVTASYSSLNENSKIAEEILSKVAETADKIDMLEGKGRRFNASRAREDLHAITSRVASLLSDVDLAQPWVKSDLGDLAEKTANIHCLFADAK